MLECKTKYFSDVMPRLEKIEVGDWIDVRAIRVEVDGKKVPWRKYSKDADPVVRYRAGSVIKVYLGFAMQMPKNYEAHVAPRGSTFKNYGIIQTNSVGVVDESYCGNKDEWFIPFYSLKAGEIGMFNRVAQFRLVEKMGDIKFKKVATLKNPNRGGHGSTGTK